MPSQCMKIFRFGGVTSFVVFCMLYGVYQYQYYYNGNYYSPYNSYGGSSSSSASSYSQQYAQYLARYFGSQYTSQYGSSPYGSSSYSSSQYRVQPGSQPQYAYQQYSTGSRAQRTSSRRSPPYRARTGRAGTGGTGRRSNALRRSGLPDLVPDASLVETTAYTENVALYRLQCAKSEKCLSSSAYSSGANQDSIRRLLRFSQRTFNEGDADFLPDSDPSQWEWHSCHQHHHSMETFAQYDLLEESSGQKVAEGHKASFCLEDTGCRRTYRKYNCALGRQGISAGCWDTYKHDIDCQWIDITDVKPGKYILEISINPERRVRESSFDNNRIQCNVRLYRNSVQVYNCIRTHLRSSRG